MAKIAGSLWVEGNDLHYVDASGIEWLGYGLSQGANPGKPGSIWIEADSVRYITEAGIEWAVYENPNVPKPYPAGAISGSIWVEVNLLHWINPTSERDNHWDVAPLVGHQDIAHIDIGAHSDTPHTDTHTDTHGDVGHGDGAHTDTYGHDDIPHSDSHTDYHGDYHADYHDDRGSVSFTDHMDCNIQYIHGDGSHTWGTFRYHTDCYSSPAGYSHSDQYHDDNSGSGPINHEDYTNHDDLPHYDVHDDVGHQDNHGDVGHGDRGHHDFSDHGDVPHADSHTDSHSDVAHQDVTHVDSSNHSDTPHTDIHTDNPHIDSPVYVGP